MCEDGGFTSEGPIEGGDFTAVRHVEGAGGGGGEGGGGVATIKRQKN